MPAHRPAKTLAVLAAAALLMLTQGVAAASSRHLLQQQQPSSSCGTEGALCGAKARSGCGTGCGSGLYCGWKVSETDTTTTVCMKVPAGCGKAGNSCCPGNLPPDGATLTASSPTPRPTCRDGSYCLHTPTLGPGAYFAPPFAVPGDSMLGVCVPVAPDCGTGPGKACCPSLYHQAINPPLPDGTLQRGLCSGNTFCQRESSPPGADYRLAKGVCVANAPGAGSLGKPCVIETSSVSTNTVCKPPGGQRGYCAYPNGTPTGDMRDMLCTLCPPASEVAKSPEKYWGC